ncbi:MULTISPECIES: zeta toxin family protein [Nocardiopsis]|uniref:UDP-N-acetylglucosamine kinase n=1 Tax=Nocardiopsis sinuspersici TaxID=501010 RepID=A0A1V3BUU2_9ACTN|nr:MULTISPECIES: zeta toxin family protein [Nocardiopsis]OOC52437.1 hypothetical protein NOSIN_00130 [Nocardiopsis sinuspersici]
MKASDFHLPEERIDHIFDRPADSEDRSQTVRESVFGGYPSDLEEPTLVLLGGQPGAGKSSAIAAVSRERAGELVPLSGDDLRPFHDDFEMLARDHPWLMPNATSQASGAWVRRCIDYALENRHSLLLEGVFRDPLTVAQTIDRFAAAGYRVEVVGVATSYRDSLLASLGRFLHPEEGAAPRWTPATAHDSAYRMVPSALQAAEDTEGTQRLHVTTRSGEDLHTNTRGPDGRWTDPTPGAAVAAAKTERDALPSPGVARAWLRLYVEHTRELAHRGQVTEPTRPTLDRLAGRAQEAAHIAFPHAPEARQAISEHSARLEATPHDTPRELPNISLPAAAPEPVTGPRRRRAGLSAARLENPPTPTRSDTPHMAEPPPQHNLQRRPGHGLRP